jgi:hypothetical protein
MTQDHVQRHKQGECGKGLDHGSGLPLLVTTRTICASFAKASTHRCNITSGRKPPARAPSVLCPAQLPVRPTHNCIPERGTIFHK